MLEIAAVVDIGVVRAKNDDRVLICNQVLDGGDGFMNCSSDVALAAVSDGVGGNAGGHICSQMVLDMLHSALTPGISPAELGRAVEAINRAVLEAQRKMPEYSAMAATLAMALAEGERLLICNAGDSRIYRLRRGRLAQLSFDHTRCNELPGLYEHLDHRDHTITRYMGKADGVSPYISDEVGDLFAGDVLLLCSDGLYDGVKEDQMRQLLGQNKPALTICHELVDAAKLQGSTDNISVVVLRKE